MLFLKQLDEDTKFGKALNEGKHVVVWEERTLALMKEMEEEKDRLNKTDYKKVLKIKKPRPREVIRKNNGLSDS